jgi:hypothetical protein
MPTRLACEDLKRRLELGGSAFAFQFMPDTNFSDKILSAKFNLTVISMDPAATQPD